ncbi:hypothetical protein Q5752_001878 [Cryptotrichosporon argae]
MRFLVLVSACAAVGAAAIVPRTLVDRSTSCATTATQSDNEVCPFVLTVGAVLAYQADNLVTSYDETVQTAIQTLLSLPAGESVFAAVAQVIGDVAEGEVSNFLYSVASLTDAAAATEYAAFPDCTCNMQLCNTEVIEAQEATAANTDTAQAACEFAKCVPGPLWFLGAGPAGADARNACGQFYTPQQFNTVVPACAQYTGTTGE